ncbi:MAG: sulfotransferase [Proteobacteria bacterium]|nr:sulfotransferase [Pseudomonadota bacterium]
MLEARLHRVARPRPKTPLRPPLIVVGLPRTGTTVLHRLLCLGDEARPLKLWELLAGTPYDGSSAVEQRITRKLNDLKRAVPGLDAKHFVAADAPEECMMLLDSTFTSATFWATSPVHGYLHWYLDQDHRAAYQQYREHLEHY